MKQSRFFKLLFAAVLSIAFVSQGTWALAGTTGSLTGTLTDSSTGKPVGDATIVASSSSQTATTQTDASGHFSFLSLSPDTYSVSANKAGYAAVSIAGVTVFADQSQTLALTTQSALKTITHVTSRSSGNLVKSGTTTDVYQVNAATAGAVATTGGGNNLNSAYSAIASVPGVVTLPGNFGFGQLVYIHGSSYSQIGYEFDGIPVNRSFDNYNANSLSNLGNQSVEVYTGGGPANATSPTLGGYINQIIKTGTYPGYGSITAGVGAPAFYHQLDVEAGGATPNRNFSWYAAVRGDNQIPDQWTDKNGADLNPDGNNKFGQQGFAMNPIYFMATSIAGFAGSGAGPWSDCTGNGAVSPANGTTLSPFLQLFYNGAVTTACNAYAPIAASNTLALRGNDLSDREAVLNLHFAIPHKHDGGRDDVQLMYNNFFYQTQAWDNASTFGGMPFIANMLSQTGTNPDGTGNWNNFLTNLLGPAPGGAPSWIGPAASPQYAGICDYINTFSLFGVGPSCAATVPGGSPFPYYDSYQVSGATYGQNALSNPNIVTPYLFPSTNPNRAWGSGFSPYQVSDTDNNGSILKAQYQKNFGSNAYLRLFGYSFYSDWLQSDPNYGIAPFGIGGATAGDYELNSHTRGLYGQFADQINSKHLVTLTGTYTTSTPLRWNNAQMGFSPSGTPIATLQDASGQCYSAYNNQYNTRTGPRFIDPSYGNVPAGTAVSCLSALAGAPIAAVQAGGCPAGSSPFSCLVASPVAGASWTLTQNVAPDANLNTVKPKFLDFALQDDFRPSDKWDVNAGVRFESYGYELGNFNSASANFWFNELNSTVCVDPTNGLSQVPASDMQKGFHSRINVPGVGGYTSYYTTAPGQPCLPDLRTGDQLYHPGQHGIPALSQGGDGTITDKTLSPRVGFTYTAGPNTVLRFSYGRYTQPTPTAFEQVLTYPDGYKMATALYGSQYYNLGLSSIVHNNPIQFSNNWDFSLEQRVPNTDVSLKLSPFYRYTSNQSLSVVLPGGLAGAFNSGTQRSKGVELAVNVGDPSRNGLSGQLAYTYTDAKLKYNLIGGNNIVSTLLKSLKPFLSLEKVNNVGNDPNNWTAFPCYIGGQGQTSCTPGTANEVVNPYYNDTITQAQLNQQFPLTAFYPTYANYFPYGLFAGDGSTSVPPNVFTGFLNWKHNKLSAAVTANLWEGNQYGSPGNFAGIDPTSCSFNQNDLGLVANSLNPDYQTCGGSIAVPNPLTGKFDNIGQYRQPWEFNLGAQVGYDISPKIHASLLLANVVNRCFGGSKEPWTKTFAPNSYICGYYPNASYVGVTPGEGYFYGNSPHDPVNGTAGYPAVFDQAYAPGSNQIPTPFQAYFQVQIKL